MLSRSFITRGSIASCDAACTAVLYDELPMASEMTHVKYELAILWLRRQRPVRRWHRWKWILKVVVGLWRDR